MRSPARPTWAVPIAMLAVVAVWGSAFSGIKVLLRHLSPGGLTAGRLLVAAASFSALWLAMGRRRVERQRGDLPRLVAIGLTGSTVYHYALNWGEQHISAGVASLVVALMPVMVAVAGVALLGDRLTRRGATGVALAFSGVVVLVLASGQGLEVGRPIGVAVTLLSPIAWVAYTLLSKSLAGRYDGISLNLLGTWVGAVVALPLGLTDLAAFASMPAEGWWWLVYLGALSTAVAYVVYAWSLRTWSASAVASFVYLVPVASFLWAWALLGEVPGVLTVAGGAMVIGGVVLVQRRRPASA